ncbi:MAG: hypothetical protein ACFFER_06470 [Candidatus Thorarchaeota archaeon]
MALPNLMEVIADVRINLAKAQGECEYYAEWLTRTEPKIEENFFKIYWKHIVSTNEILRMYMDTTLEIEPLLFRKDYDERFMLVLRASWIFQMSVSEYSMKKILRDSKGSLSDWYQNLPDHSYVKGEKRGGSLRNIVEKSKDLGIIDNEQCTSWISLQEMRNAIIHNNGFIEEDKCYAIGKVKKKIKAGDRIKYSHMNSAFFIRYIPTLSKMWLEGVINSHIFS